MASDRQTPDASAAPRARLASSCGARWRGRVGGGLSPSSAVLEMADWLLHIAIARGVR
ncbi:poly-beta-hydroxybutyrate polymerase N-terminal domain-containing protein [Paraburkholderia sp. UYCP14C]|uniref:poly-beta-hydroxybutyrate polymerase N-terminal domain-containing protein n=1 Tax=Paraburkholderia sp. UYCP14C TaxID=2511130 RepID=UPI001459FD7A